MLGWPATPFGLGVVWPPPSQQSGGGRTTPRPPQHISFFLSFFLFLVFFKIKYVMGAFWEKKKVKMVELSQFESLRVKVSYLKL